MAKKSIWFGWLSWLFVCQEKPRAEQKSKRCGWLKFKRRPSLGLPAPESVVSEATEKQRKYALTVALATAAAAEAAVAAAQAAAEVVRLTGVSGSYRYLTRGDENLAAIRIQSAFRAHLARKALRALKGLVKLQAIVRGRAVRRQIAMQLKQVPSNLKIQTQPQLTSSPTIDVLQKHGENMQTLNPSRELKYKENKEINHKKELQSPMLSQAGLRSWDCSTLSKENLEDLWLKKQEAAVRRDRMMKYSFSHRERRNTHMLEESLCSKGSSQEGRWGEQWADKDPYRRDSLDRLKPIALSKTYSSEMLSPGQIRVRNLQKRDLLEPLCSPVFFPRRSFSRAQRSMAGDAISHPNSPVFPTYMATTESAKAKTRSLSTPRLRAGLQESLSLDHSLLCKNSVRVPFWSTYNGESLGIIKTAASQQINPVSKDRSF